MPLETDPNALALIRAEKLRVIYNRGKQNEIQALKEINVSIYPQEYVIIFGPSGCGKSTLLYSFSGLQRASEGAVFFKGKALGAMSRREELDLHQTGMGMIFQAFYLISSLNILDNICLPKVFRSESPSVRRKVGYHLLRRFGIAEQADKFPSQLSGGQKQRVAIARSLMNNPDIILADEPVGNLDSESAENVLRILKELNEVDKKTVIMVTHNPEHLPYADRVIFMKDGYITKEEVHKEKRPIKSEGAEKKREEESPETMELKMLMNSFKNLLPQQMDVLLVPFKAKQLLAYLLSDLNDDQITTAEGFLKELLFKNIDTGLFSERLDRSLDLGGAGWNKMRAQHFSTQVAAILHEVETLKQQGTAAIPGFLEYLTARFHLRSLSEEQRSRFQAALLARFESHIGQIELQKKLDDARSQGGVGLNKLTVEKIVREVEIIMLLKYS
ncbi:MAG: ABC transporter ATP-binding protein [Candidatus Moraniibacteriota bacterium]